MIQKGNTMFYKNKNNLFNIDDKEISNLSPIKKYKKITFGSKKYDDNNSIIRKQYSLKYIKSKPLIISRDNFIKNNKNELKNNKSFNKIIQKEIFFTNNLNLNSPIKKKNQISTIPINTINNNYYINIGNKGNIIQPKNENKIKNIHISLKKIKLGNHKSLSRNNSPKNINMETFIYKYPKRQISLYTERNYNYDNQDNLSETQTITSFNNSGLLSKINISPKKNNFIPKPNLRHEFIKRNKKIDKNLLDQSQEIKMRFKRENEIIKMKNEFFNKKGILPEHKIEFENKAIKIQSYFRRYIQLKNQRSLKNKFNKMNICRINEIMIKPKINENSNNNKVSLINYKYILKYLLIKKEQRRSNILKVFFEKYRNKAFNNRYMDNKPNIENKIIINENELRNNKLKDLLQKKAIKNKELLLRNFLKYYYKCFYINFNWFISFINQIENSNKTNNYITNLYNNSKLFSYYSKEKNIKNALINDKNYLSIHSNELKEAIKKMNNTESKELKKFYLRDILSTINKINKEKEKIEKNKFLKNFILILFLKMKNILGNIHKKFYYKLLFVYKSSIENAKKKIDKINYLRKIIQKHQKELLRKYFNRFIINILLYNPKTNKSKNNSENIKKELNLNAIKDDTNKENIINQN